MTVLGSGHDWGREWVFGGTNMRLPSHVMRIVQLNPKMVRKPKLRLRTGFLPRRASAASSRAKLPGAVSCRVKLCTSSLAGAELESMAIISRPKVASKPDLKSRKGEKSRVVAMNGEKRRTISSAYEWRIGLATHLRVEMNGGQGCVKEEGNI
jgi:hypothetical protein